MSILEQIVRRLEDFVLVDKGLDNVGRIPFKHNGKTEHGFPYIRSACGPFEAALLSCAQLIGRPKETLRFLEVGCGLGTKCGIARLHGLQVWGVDLKSEYVELADRIFPDCEFTQANAYDVDYSQYDLVYYHRPVSEDSMIFQLENRILSQLPNRGVLFVTDLSHRLQQALYDQAGRIKPALSSKLLDPSYDLGRIRVLQKTEPFTSLLDHLPDGSRLQD